MAEQFDVVVVGARCAGSPLAAMLARSGLKVAVLEQATFPRDTLSTHAFQAPAITFLDRLGVTDKIKATGAQYLDTVDMRLNDLQITFSIPARPGDVGGLTSVRRFLLDPILAEAAADAGADVQMDSRVIGTVVEGGRVAGVRVSTGGSERVVNARLLVGADGRNSTVAKLVGARKYNLTPNERFAYWSFFEDANLGPDPAVVFHRWKDQFVLGIPSDGGLYQVIVIPENKALPEFRADLEGSYLKRARACEPVAAIIDGANRVGRIFGAVHWEGFFREPSGRGWVLAGDSGHFKDPAPGWGIADAFRQVETLAPRIIDNLDADIDGAMRSWGRWRDDDAYQHYWLATDLGKAGPFPRAVAEAAARLIESGGVDDFGNIFLHRAMPFDVLTRGRVVAATGRLLVRRGCDRRAVMRETRGIVMEDTHRKRLARKPAYAQGAEIAAETEVD